MKYLKHKFLLSPSAVCTERLGPRRPCNFFTWISLRSLRMRFATYSKDMSLPTVLMRLSILNKSWISVSCFVPFLLHSYNESELGCLDFVQDRPRSTCRHANFGQCPDPSDDLSQFRFSSIHHYYNESDFGCPDLVQDRPWSTCQHARSWTESSPQQQFEFL